MFIVVIDKKIMGGNTGEIQIGSEREMYKYINHRAGTSTKARSKNNLSTNIQYIWLEVPEYSMNSEVVEKDTN